MKKHKILNHKLNFIHYFSLFSFLCSSTCLKPRVNIIDEANLKKAKPDIKNNNNPLISLIKDGELKMIFYHGLNDEAATFNGFKKYGVNVPSYREKQKTQNRVQNQVADPKNIEALESELVGLNNGGILVLGGHSLGGLVAWRTLGYLLTDTTSRGNLGNKTFLKYIKDKKIKINVLTIGSPLLGSNFIKQMSSELNQFLKILDDNSTGVALDLDETTAKTEFNKVLSAIKSYPSVKVKLVAVTSGSNNIKNLLNWLKTKISTDYTQLWQSKLGYTKTGFNNFINSIPKNDFIVASNSSSVNNTTIKNNIKNISNLTFEVIDKGKAPHIPVKGLEETLEEKIKEVYHGQTGTFNISEAALLNDLKNAIKLQNIPDSIINPKYLPEYLKKIAV